jgi:PAS domain S-box-containing protein
MTKSASRSEHVVRGILSGYQEVKGVSFFRSMSLIGSASMVVMGIGAWLLVPDAREFVYDRIAFVLIGLGMFLWGGMNSLRIGLYTRVLYVIFYLYTFHMIAACVMNRFHAAYLIPALIITQMISLSFRKRDEAYIYIATAGLIALAGVLYHPDVAGREAATVIFAFALSGGCNVLLISFKSDFIDHIKLNRDLLRSLVNKSEAAIFVTDIRGVILDCNSRAAVLFQYDRSGLVGRDFRFLRRHALEESEILRGLEELERGNFWNSENELLRSDGISFDAQMSVTMVRRKGQRFLVYRVRDYTAVKAFEKELLRAKEKAEEAVAVRSQFLATMSHEIRTPLNGVIGMTSLLEHTRLDDRQKEYVDTIQKSGQSLMVLINDILDYSKMESGKMVVREEVFPLRESVSEVCDLLRPHAELKGIRLELAIAQDVPMELVTDAPRLKQVLLNLIGNAVKFTDKGFVRITCETGGALNDRVNLQFEVSDSGIGIHPEKQQLLFQPFSQVSNDGERRYGGTGLGLAISRQIIETLGGEIRVKSEEGVGSAFTFTVSARQVSDPEERYGSSGSQSAELTQLDNQSHLRILVAEDNPINQSVLLFMLETLGMKADVVADGKEVIRQVAVKRYDIIFMDVQMPEMNGMLASSWIRAHSKYQPYIICMTANSSEEDRQRCQEAGMDDFMPKPFDLERMKSALRHYVRRCNPSPNRAA